jgi:hypothetical protein
MLSNIPASANEFAFGLFDATVRHTEPLPDIATLSHPSLNNPVFVSFVKLILGLATFP